MRSHFRYLGLKKISDEILKHVISEVTKWIVRNVVYCGVAKQLTVRVNK